MPPNIFGSRFLGHRQPAWHGLGKTFNKPLAASDALAEAGMIYAITKEPLYFLAEGHLVWVPDRVALVREKTDDDPVYRVFGVVGQNYGLVQNKEIARLLDALTDVWPVETAGALGYGETIFLTLAAGSVNVAGDELKQYFLVTDSRTGRESLRIAFTPIRVVCQNTLVAGLRAARVSVSLRHVDTLKDDLGFAIEIIRQMQTSQTQMIKLFRKLSETVITIQEVHKILQDAYPTPRKTRTMLLAEETDFANERWRIKVGKERLAWKSARDSIWRCRGAALWLFDRICSKYPDIAMTPWAAYNAVVECEDYREGRGEKAICRSALFGHRAATKKRALEAARATLE